LKQITSTAFMLHQRDGQSIVSVNQRNQSIKFAFTRTPLA